MKRLLTLIILISMATICAAQSKSVKVLLKNGTTITGVLEEMDATSHIVLKVAGISNRIKMSDIDSISEVVPENNSAEVSTSQVTPQDSTSPFPIIDESDIHGSYIAEGNCVYIPVDSPREYERAGQIKLRECMKEWGYWTVVNAPEQAHFVLQMFVMTAGYDQILLLIRPRSYYSIRPYNLNYDSFTCNLIGEYSGINVIKISKGGNFEENDTTEKAARVLTSYMKDLLTPITGRWEKLQRKFFKRAESSLNADSSSHYSSLPMMHSLTMHSYSTYHIIDGITEWDEVIVF